MQLVLPDPRYSQFREEAGDVGEKAAHMVHQEGWTGVSCTRAIGGNLFGECGITPGVWWSCRRIGARYPRLRLVSLKQKR